MRELVEAFNVAKIARKTLQGGWERGLGDEWRSEEQRARQPLDASDPLFSSRADRFLPPSILPLPSPRSFVPQERTLIRSHWIRRAGGSLALRRDRIRRRRRSASNSAAGPPVSSPQARRRMEAVLPAELLSQVFFFLQLQRLSFFPSAASAYGHGAFSFAQSVSPCPDRTRLYSLSIAMASTRYGEPAG